MRLNKLCAVIAFVALTASCVLAEEKLPEAPGFTLRDLKGETVSLSDQKGKVVFLDFWASWCPPCRRSIPEVEALSKKFSAPDFALFGINLESDPEAIRKFAEQQGMTYPVLLGDEKVSRAYKIGGIPAFFLIDREGRIAKRYVGYYPGLEREWEKDIKTLLGKSTGKAPAAPSKPKKKSPSK